jgi:predicted acylesterase/phospholipase RssA
LCAHYGRFDLEASTAVMNDDVASGRIRFVLGGGGAMGAYQAGALLALFEHGLHPDALYGCSAGALNAAFLASRPSTDRAAELADWWCSASAHEVLSPTWRSHMRGLPAVVRAGARGILDERPLRALVAANVPAHDLSELAVPITVTTTCLDCGAARHHSSGSVVDVLVASCALPGLFAPVRLADGHLHVDGGVVAGVPVQAALDDAGPDDMVVVLDCGLAPVTGRAQRCAASSAAPLDQACGLLATAGRNGYVAPTEGSRGALDVVLKAFTVARAVANRASVGPALDDPRVRVVPHIADAWAAGLLASIPAGPRDFRQVAQLSRAGHQATTQWLTRGAAHLPAQVSPAP